MKNRIIVKYYIISILEIIGASILAIITMVALRNIVPAVLIVMDSLFDFYFYNIGTNLYYSLMGNFLILLLSIGIFLLYYWLICKKRLRGLAAIIEESKIMADGDLNRVINIEAPKEITYLANNINSISSQLREITIAERNAQRTKTDLITNVSHDLRTPLTSIIGYLELIDNDKYRDEIELRYYVNIAYEKAKGLRVLINDLFELTKMQNSTITLKKENINLVDLLGQVVATFEYQFKNSNMESRNKFSEDKIIVLADGEKLVRAFDNILSNAIKYGKDGVFVDIITKVENNKGIIQIINYGEPISSIHLPQIFDRFYRIEESRNSEIGGSGLGLAITKNIIELHNGKISVKSDEYSTVFQIELPII